MRKVPVALIQFDAIPEQPRQNLDAMRRLATSAASTGARWIMFHEGTLTDYTPRLAELAEPVPGGPATREVQRLSAEIGVHISFGLSESHGGRFYITQVFVSPDGSLYRYRKTWLWREPGDRGFRNEWSRYDPGSGPELFTFDGVTSTCFICADGEAPRCVERAAALQPQLVFYPNNRGYLPDFPRFGRRAAQIKAPMLVTNRVGASWTESCQGGCVAYDQNGKVIAAANRNGREEVLHVTIEL